MSRNLPGDGTAEGVSELDADARAAIAAGEVITRPADVVVELVENALDAGAGRVEVGVRGDGTERIRVADDGRGMARPDAALAVERHTTSKIDGAGDLAAVSSLGFRGEALPSVAAAGTLELTTSDGGAEGTRVRVDRRPGTDEEDRKQVVTAGRARGTTVEVRELFSARPARRKSLASAAAEFERISDAVAARALARPDVAFVLEHDGRETFATPGTGEYRDATLGVYDRSVARESTAFEHRTEIEVDGNGRDVRIEGLLAYPSITRAAREHVHVAVAGRPVTNDRLARAVVDGYGTLLPDARYPIAVLDVDLPPDLVDPNVDPAKREVGLRAADAVAGAVGTAVGDALATADLRHSAEVAMDIESSLDPVEADSAFAEATVIGRFRDLYLLCEAGDDLLVVDGHAAHERINFERLRGALDDGAVPSAELEPPETLSLSPAGAAAVEAHAEELARLGFDAEPFGGGTVRLRAVPAPLGRTADADAFRDALDALRAGDPPADRREELLKDLACHPSLKAGDALAGEEAAALLERLGACEQPFACPHGRPTVLSIDEATLVRGFDRGNTRLG